MSPPIVATQTSNVKIGDINRQLSRIDEALADPKHADKKPALNELRRQYVNQQEALVKEITGNALPHERDGVEKLFQHLHRLWPELDAAQAKWKSAIAQLTADVEVASKVNDKYLIAAAAATKLRLDLAAGKKPDPATLEAAKPYDALLAQVDAASAQVDATKAKIEGLEQTIAALERAQTVLAGELKRRQEEVFDLAKKTGNPLAGNAVDLVDYASDNQARQRQLLGAPVVGVTVKQAIDADVGRLALAAKGGHPDEGANRAARVLQKQLEFRTTQQQKEFLEAASNPANNLIGQIAGRAQVSSDVAVPLLSALNTAQGTARAVLARELAKATTSMKSEVIKVLDARMKNAYGFEEAYALELALKESGNHLLAAQVRGLWKQRFDALVSDFEAKNKAVAGPRGDLARLVAGFGKLLPGDKVQAGIDAFKRRHEKAFEEWERSGEKLARAGKFIVEHASWNEKAAELLPEALSTKGGEQIIAGALKDQAAGLPTLLDDLPTFAKNATKIGKYAPVALWKGFSSKALSLASNGDKNKAVEYFKNTLEANAGFFQVKPASFDDAAKALRGVLDGEEGALYAFDKQLRKLKPDSASYNALRGFAWTAAIVAGIDGWKDGEIKDKVKALADMAGAGGEAVGFGFEVLAKHLKKEGLGKFGKALGKGAGGAANAIGAVFEGAAMVKAFSKGDLVEGGASMAMAVGGTILAIDGLAGAAGLQVIPLWGQVAGAVLVIGGIAVKWAHADAKAEKEWEDHAQAFLERAGIDKDRANELSDLKVADGRNVGMMIQLLAPALGMEPRALFERIVKMDKGAINEFVDMSKDLVLVDGQIATALQGPTDKKTMEKRVVSGGLIEKSYPQSLSTAVAWTKEFLKNN